VTIRRGRTLGSTCRGKGPSSYFCVITVIITLLLIGICAPGDAGGKEYLVRNVVDGDTVELANGKKVRYTGIDTPETMKRIGRDWLFDPEAFGVEAKEFNRSMVFKKKVTLEFDVTKKDKYDRWLAYVYVDGKMANEELIRQGLATVYTFPPNVRHLDLLLEAQEDARKKKRGLWGALKSISPGEARNSIGRFRVVTGEVFDVGISPHKIFLNMGSDRSKDLTAVIFTRNIPLFRKKRIDPYSHYRARRVEVVGKIEDQGGPVMIIDNPSQIRIIEP